ncbi:MAG: LysR family transcriptional regulator [Hyphomicrobiales bacterium]|nr:MAG: LysR family transcriptional regulator [Hyphomicrobiales bacterium]
MITLRQIRSVVAVAEEGSFTKAAIRENATQSGISQHISSVERELDVALFIRNSDGVQLTPAGRNYYPHAVGILRAVESSSDEARAVGKGISGDVRAGLMPAFTRSVLVPALERVIKKHPAINVKTIEGYSGQLTSMVRAEQLDFALVPAFAGRVGLTIAPVARDREMLVSGPEFGLVHSQDVKLSDLAPLKLIIPTDSNVRHDRILEYIEGQNIKIDRLMEMDTMLGTLGLVKRTDWVTILPGLICVGDKDGKLRRINPLIDPSLYSDFVTIEPATKPISQQAAVFLAELKTEIDRLSTV